MNKEQRYFLILLSDYIQDKKHLEELGGEKLNWNLIQEYAKKHQVEGIIYYQTKRREFYIPYMEIIAYYANREKELKNLLKKMRDIPFFIVKGNSIAELYPVPALRTMGDSDIVVHTADRNQVHSIMLSLGFENAEKDEKREWQYYKNGMEFELHDRLVYKENVNHPKQERFFEDVWAYVKENELDWNVHFLYLLSHLRKHFMNEGVGFRQFLDIAIVTQNADLDWTYIKKKLKEIELFSFAKTVLTFNELWFGVPSPLGKNSITERFFEEATQKIFKNGIFGFDNEENETAGQINIYLKNGIVGLGKEYIKELFPSYKYLLESGHYLYLEGKKYLIPIAWINRFIYTIRHRQSSKGIARLKKKNISRSEILERKKIYKDWGIN